MGSKKKPFSNGRSLIAHQSPLSLVAEQYRTLRTNIEFSSIDRELQTLMITSSTPGEGKSTTASNLAVVFAQQEKKVLIIDADLRKPTMHDTFRIENTVGLTNVLTKQHQAHDAVKQTQIKNLDILTSGPIPPNPAELLGSKGMRETLGHLKEQYDYIIIDTPPVLAVTDAKILANHCDGIMLVVHSGKTEVTAAKRAKEAIINANGNMIGAILNGQKQKKHQYYYYR
ncbi:CpsD/CapB family tyrosine-protein kinase [Bacillus tianshenii]|nr:CpsD/CapB family tyrosine-protein kinase [Bacillus tianshenii]